MSNVHGPVCFTASKPLGVPPGALVFGVNDVVEEEIVATSSVLKMIAETGGDAELPGVVSLQAFRTWLWAATDQDTEEEFNTIPFDTICAVVQVRYSL